MPSFDIVSKIDSHELTNAVDQATREITNRFDFKGVKASFTHQEETVTLTAESEFQLKQMLEIFTIKCSKRNVDPKCFTIKDPQSSLHEAKQAIVIREGIETELAKKIVKFIKDSKLKVQASIQGEQIRVTGKKRDDLQDAIAQIRAKDWGLPLQFTNFRD